MSSKFARPERSIRSELITLFAISLVPLGIMSVFPYRAIGYKFKQIDDKPRAFASLVFLSEEQEEAAIQRARSAWQTSNASEKGFEIDLSMESLPELGNSTVLETPLVHQKFRPMASSLEYVPLALPSLAAETPNKAEAAPIVSEKYFNDEDLMQLK